MKETNQKNEINLDNNSQHKEEQKLFTKKLSKLFTNQNTFSNSSKQSLPYLEITNLSNSASKEHLHSLNNMTMSSLGAIKLNQQNSIHKHSNSISTNQKSTNQDYYNIEYSLRNTYNQFLLGNNHNNKNNGYFGYLKCTKNTKDKVSQGKQSKIKIYKKIKREDNINNIQICKEDNSNNVNIVKHSPQITDAIRQHYLRILRKTKFDKLNSNTQSNNAFLFNYNKKKIHDKIVLNMKKQTSQISSKLFNNPKTSSNHKLIHILFSNKTRKTIPLINTKQLSFN